MTRAQAFAALAQGVVNIDSGLTTIEAGSRVHFAMIHIVEMDWRRMNGKRGDRCAGRCCAADRRMHKGGSR